MATPVTSSVVWPNYSASNVAKAADKSTALGKDQFLSLFVAQLQNQDPLTPMNNSEFIAQMAQFSSVEQLMNMSNEISMLRLNIGAASSLIGKYVTWNEYDSNGDVIRKNGLVESVVSQDGNLFVEVDGKLVGIDFVGQISSEPIKDSDNDSESSEGSTNNESGNSEAGNSSNSGSAANDEVSGS